uniref:Uncharacterized protein n=1 Tax=Panagrolaimus sp. ES5 TaxID=591445 RepID=A0AC34GB14_9BILA
MDDIAQLQHLELVSRVCTELENHLGINEKEVAEFIIALAKENSTFNKFKTALSEHGLDGGLDDSLMSSLLRMIMNAQPRPADKPFNTIKDEKEELKAMFPALAMANTANPLADFEGLMGKWEQENKNDEPDSKSRRNRSHSPRRRRRSRSLSNSRERKKSKRDDGDDRKNIEVDSGTQKRTR